MAAVIETPAVVAPQQATSPAFDWLLIIAGGLPLILPVVFILGENRLRSVEPIHWYVWINSLFSSPHVYSTYVRLGRKIRERRVSAWLGLPAYLAWVALLMAVFTVDQIWALGAFVILITAINVWQSFHYLRQTYGVGRFFQREYGQYQTPGSGARLMYWAYHLAMPALILGRWNTLWIEWEGRTYNNIVPLEFAPWFMNMLWVIAGLGLLGGIVAEWRNWRANREHYSPIGIMNLAIYFFIHTLGFVSLEYFNRGFIAVTIFHGVQYLALVWKLEKKNYDRQPTSFYSKIPLVSGFVGFWVLLMLFGACYEHGFAGRLVGSMGYGEFAPYISTLVVALLTGVSAHHYTVDMFIWRRKAGL